MTTLFDIPNDVFVDILCFTLNDTQDINNFCEFFNKISFVSQNLCDGHWKKFCKTIKIPDNFKLNTWKNTFFKFNHIDVLLANSSKSGNFYKVRELKDEIKMNYSVNRHIPKHVLDNVFSFKNYGNLLQILREILIYPIDQNANIYLQNMLIDISDKYHTYGSLGVHIFREIRWHVKKFNLSIALPQNLRNYYYY